MRRNKISKMNAFRSSIAFRNVVDDAVQKENSNFSNFVRDALKMKLESLGIEMEVLR